MRILRCLGSANLPRTMPFGCWSGRLRLATNEDKLTNRSFLISAAGEVVAHYDKIHMFDVTLPNGREIRESSTYVSGNRAVVAATPWAQLGLSICYDVRFPALYRALAQAGAEVLVVPAAFTKATGTVHWKALLQARAIENGAYVVAAATCGTHPGGHETYGHAMIIDPNGQVVAEAGVEPDVICATIDLAVVAAARGRLPSLTHDRAFELDAYVAHYAMTRFEAIQRDQMSARQREVADAIASGPRGRFEGPIPRSHPQPGAREPLAGIG